MRKYRVLILVSVFFLAPAELFSLPGEKNAKEVIFTFDDGPRPGVTEKIIGILDKNDIKATFFLVGKMISRYPEIVRKIKESGHEIANHTYTHRRIDSLTPGEVIVELKNVDEELRGITGGSTRYFRPPGGRLNSISLELVRKSGYHTVLWTRHVNDISGIKRDEIFERATRDPGRYELIMMHDGPSETVKALPDIIGFYRDRNYRFTTISQALSEYDGINSVSKRWPVLPGVIREEYLVSDADNPVKSKMWGGLFFFTAIGGTALVSVIRKNRKKSGKRNLSLAVISLKEELMEDLLDRLEILDVKITFFLTPGELKKIIELNIPGGFRGHALALRGGLDDISERLSGWGRISKTARAADILRIFCVQEINNGKNIGYLRREGYLPVKCKMNIPGKAYRNSRELKRHLLKNFTSEKVIPVSINDKRTIDALSGFCTTVMKRGYFFVSLEDYMLERYAG